MYVCSSSNRRRATSSVCNSGFRRGNFLQSSPLYKILIQTVDSLDFYYPGYFSQTRSYLKPNFSAFSKDRFITCIEERVLKSVKKKKMKNYV